MKLSEVLQSQKIVLLDGAMGTQLDRRGLMSRGRNNLDAPEAGVEGPKLFGTFGGVFTPTLLTILGVIMYLRLPWVVGNAGLIGAFLVVGLPGNPVSVMVCFEVYVRPALRKLAGQEIIFRPTVQGRFIDEYRRQPGRVEWVRVRMEERDGQTWIRPSAAQGSGILRSMVHASGLAEVPADAGAIPPGTEVTVLLTGN